MTANEIIILGALQGLTEFLPVSSSGHLAAARLLFGISNLEGSALDAYLHLGTLLAVIVFYWLLWLAIIKSLFNKKETSSDKRQLLLKLLVATIPAAIAGFLFQDWIELYFRTPTAVATGLLLTALVLLALELAPEKKLPKKNASFTDALIVGLTQCVALIPGVSRSGVTIAAGFFRGLSRKQAVNFSFLISAPIIAGAGLTNLQTLAASGSFPASQLLLGLIISFVCGLMAIYTLLKIVQKISFWPFILYLIALATLLFVYA